jgi:hypothetical protein
MNKMDPVYVTVMPTSRATAKEIRMGKKKERGGAERICMTHEVGRTRREQAGLAARDAAAAAQYAGALGTCFAGAAGPEAGATRGWCTGLLAEMLPPPDPAAAALEGLGVQRSALAACCEQEMRTALAALARVGGDAPGLQQLLD